MAAPPVNGRRQYIAAAKLNPVERRALHDVMARHQLSSISDAVRLGLELAGKLPSQPSKA